MPIKSLTEVAKKDFELLKKYQTGQLKPIKTDRPWLDEVFGGLLPGDIVTIAGGSGSGKTYELHRVKANLMNPEINPEANDYVFLDNSFEMRNLNLMIREINKRTGKSKGDILTTEFTPEEREVVKEYYKQITDGRFFIEEETCTPEVFKENTEVFIKKHVNKKAIFISIDHMALVKSKGDKKNSVDEIVETVNYFKLKYDNVYFLLLSQLNRSILGRTADKSNLAAPQRNDLYQSDTMFHISDYVYVTHNPYRLGIGQYLKVNHNMYDHLTMFFGEISKNKASFNTVGNIFYHVLKARENDVVFSDIFIEHIEIPEKFIEQEIKQEKIMSSDIFENNPEIFE